jgi:hypothetical protein
MTLPVKIRNGPVMALLGISHTTVLTHKKKAYTALFVKTVWKQPREQVEKNVLHAYRGTLPSHQNA